MKTTLGSIRAIDPNPGVREIELRDLVSSQRQILRWRKKDRGIAEVLQVSFMRNETVGVYHRGGYVHYVFPVEVSITSGRKRTEAPDL